jgi:hypothetical protein
LAAVIATVNGILSYPTCTIVRKIKDRMHAWPGFTIVSLSISGN